MGSAKLADFGFAVRLKGEETMTGPACGTPEYVAPEILLQQPFCGRADVWSAGVTAFCLLSGTMPFRGLTLDKLYTAILDGACSFAGPEWRRISPRAMDFVRRMLAVDVKERWTSAELMNHSWVSGVTKPTIEPRALHGGVSGRGRALRRPRVRLKGAILAIMFVNTFAKPAAWVLSRESSDGQQHELGSP